MKFIDQNDGAMYRVREMGGAYKVARMRPEDDRYSFVSSRYLPWRTEKTEAEADLLNFAIEHNLKRLED